MAQQTINVGAAPNDGTGDPARTAFTKSNDNFTELYARGTVAAPQGRLTLQTATPVMTTTQSAKTTIYYTPYIGNQIPIYDGTNMVMTTFAELSVATTDTTKSPAAIGASKVNDWFVWNDAGAIRLSHGPDWTTDILRAPAGNTPIMVKGVWVNDAAITNGPASQRGTYVGTTRSNASSQIDWIVGGTAAGGSAAFLWVWNCYNRVDVVALVKDSTANWTPAAGSRSLNSSNNNRVTAVFGLSEDAVAAFVNASAVNGTTNQSAIGIGVNSTTAFTGTFSGIYNTGGVYTPIFGECAMIAPLGNNFWQAVEAVSTGTTIVGSTTVASEGLRFTARM